MAISEEKNSEYKKGFGDGYTQGRKAAENDINKKVDQINKKLDDAIDQDKADKPGSMRNG